MARDRSDMAFNPLHDTAKVKRPAYQALGVWNGDTFSFHSPQHERDWRSQAYRQSVRDDRWQTQPPVDHRTQTLLDDKPEIGEGQFYRGPDGMHRRKTSDQREDSDVQAIRRTAFDNYARTGVTWADLAAYDDNKPHPGEEEAVALSQAKTGTEAADKALAWPNKTRDMGVLPKNPHAITQFPGNLGLGLDQLADPWDEGSRMTTPPDVLVAGNYQANAPAIPRGWVTEPSFGAPKKPITPTKGRRDFVEGLIGRPANDNVKPAAGANTKARSESKLIGPAQPSSNLSPRTGIGMTAEEVAEAEYMNGLFNWQRQGKAAPAPKEYAIHAVSDEGRFSYLEEMKDEWSRLVEVHPEKVLTSMIGEVEKLSVAAQRDFHTAHHREPTAQEIVEIDNALEKVVFAPAEHWTDTARSPNHRGGEVAPKPYVALLRPQILTGNELAGLLEQAGTIIVQSSVEREGGRLGSRVSREDVELITKKLAAAIKACGGNVTAELYASKEPQVQYIRGQVRQSRYPDSGVPFEINGRSVAPFVTHYTPKADGISMITREAEQLRGLVVNLARAIYHGELGIDAAGIGSIPKRAKGQTNEEYEKLIDGLIKDMIDCRRPFLIKLDIDPLDIETSLD